MTSIIGKQGIGESVAYYNGQRYYEAYGNLTPTTVFFGRETAIQAVRTATKQRTLALRRT